jgi:hypothetical protein
MDPVRWFPTTEAELSGALTTGAFRERHFVDVKRVLEPGEKANARLAVDLAAFAVDSGVVVVGVDDQSAALIPFALAGLKERIDQVARSRLDPPLTVAVNEIPADGRPGEGFLVIVVPASPAAPHMVDGRYRGRSDTTNAVLSDAEVRRIRTLRAEALRSIRAILEAEVARDPVSEEVRQQAHLFIVAQPVFADPEMLQRAIATEWQSWIGNEILNPPRLDQEWSPDLPSLQNRVRRVPEGWSATTLEQDRDAGDRFREGYMLDLMIHEDGGVRLFSGRGSDTYGRNTVEPGRKVIIEAVVAGLAARVVDTARAVADKTGYVGNWDFGLALTGTRHTYSFTLASNFFADPLPYAGDNYVQTTSATFAELVSAPEAVVDRLFGRLNRTLNVKYAPPRHRQ